MFHKKTKPIQVEVDDADFEIGQDLGGFFAYIQPTSLTSKKDSGYIANFYAENGNDANSILALGISKFKNLIVKVNVYGIKKETGEEYVENGEKHPCLSTFIAKILPPQIHNLGNTAKFEGVSLADNDLINQLNHSKNKGCLAFIQVQFAGEGALANEIQSQKPLEELKLAETMMTPEEKKLLEAKQRKAKLAEEILQKSGFFSKPVVIRALNPAMDAKESLAKEGEAFVGFLKTLNCPVFGCQCKVEKTFALPFAKESEEMKGFITSGLCSEHFKEYENDVLSENVNAPDPVELIIQFNRFSKAKFVKKRLKEALNVEEGFYIPVEQMVSFAAETNILSLLPQAYLMMK